MAIKKEFVAEREDGVKLFRTFSNDNRKIVQNETGIIFDDVVDVEDAGFTYTEIFKEE